MSEYLSSKGSRRLTTQKWSSHSEGGDWVKSEGVHGQGYGVGEKSQKRTEVVPPVSSLSPTLRIFTDQLLGNTGVSSCMTVLFRHILCLLGTYCPHWAPLSRTSVSC